MLALPAILSPKLSPQLDDEVVRSASLRNPASDRCLPWSPGIGGNDLAAKARLIRSALGIDKLWDVPFEDLGLGRHENQGTR
jgi:hypothetical protein